jgi:hypothetical protein
MARIGHTMAVATVRDAVGVGPDTGLAGSQRDGLDSACRAGALSRVAGAQTHRHLVAHVRQDDLARSSGAVLGAGTCAEQRHKVGCLSSCEAQFSLDLRLRQLSTVEQKPAPMVVGLSRELDVARSPQRSTLDEQLLDGHSQCIDVSWNVSRVRTVKVRERQIQYVSCVSHSHLLLV